MKMENKIKTKMTITVMRILRSYDKQSGEISKCQDNKIFKTKNEVKMNCFRLDLDRHFMNIPF